MRRIAGKVIHLLSRPDGSGEPSHPNYPHPGGIMTKKLKNHGFVLATYIEPR
jgi:hypothetical protein